MTIQAFQIVGAFVLIGMILSAWLAAFVVAYILLWETAKARRAVNAQRKFAREIEEFNREYR